MPKKFWIDRDSTLRLRGQENPVRYGDSFDTKKVNASQLKLLEDQGKIADKLVEAKSSTTVSDLERVKAVHKEEIAKLREEMQGVLSENDDLKKVVAEKDEEIARLNDAISGISVETEKAIHESPLPATESNDELAEGAGPKKVKK